MKSIQINTGFMTEQNGLAKSGVWNASEKKGVNKQGNKQNGFSVFAGDTNLVLQDQIGQKMVKAQKEALKKIADVFESDLKIDKVLQDSQLHKKELLEQVEQYDKEIAQITKAQDALKEEYGITKDSEEEQNLDLIRKSLNDPMSMTEEEVDKLEQMGPVTEYQRAALELDEAKEEWQKRRDKAINAHLAESKKTQGIELARLESDPMVGAKKESEAILEEASDSIVTMLYEEAKENIEEQFGNKPAEKENTEETEETEDETVKTDNSANADSSVIEADVSAKHMDMLKRIQLFIKKQGILKEDTLGIKIDELL